jgi:outer membrane receptor for ferrienterochelin and colicin
MRKMSSVEIPIKTEQDSPIQQEPFHSYPAANTPQSPCCLDLYSRIRQLEKELSEQQVRNHDLINHLSWWTQQFDEMAIERDVLRLGLDQHKEDILQKMKDLAERDRTIATQNYLLGLAHVDAQKLAVTRQKCEHTINVLKEYIAGLSINGGEEMVSAKKRKVSP